ncbi:innate immunity activator protein isoform X4 [Rousettus aegyptiacus]|uniref:Innate immunity activator n=1 Tax=Rousettus aegyptiacus TaxID=9407 RepID=A0A7J8B8W2_ROUAE|nr:innate immunity activator protein isoform X4 [Rousettus aegyptiacus]KAF6395283.1 innate immunity activator [Rousettus aegyptiacus]
MLQMPKLNGTPPGRAVCGRARGERRRPGHAGPAAAGPEPGARARARGAAAPEDSWGNSRPPVRPGPGWEQCHLPLLCAPSSQKPAMESKDEVSSTDSGVILQSGPDSPVSPLKELKEAKELTYAMRRQQRALEGRLEACLEELRALCLREAELTGVLPAEYPLKPGEKAPKVRRRVGAAYRLDEQALSREDPLSSLERELALQLQIAEAARRLSREEHLGRQARRQRKHAVRQEEQKLRELERHLGAWRRHSGPPPAPARPLGRELSASDDSSLSDGPLREEEAAPGPEAPPESPPLPPQSLEGLQPAGAETAGLDRAPIQNSPWRETSLDHPYEKPRKSSEPSSESSSPASPLQDQPGAPGPRLPEPAPSRSVPGQWQGRTSAPPTPEVRGRRGQSLRVDSFRAGPRRRPTHYTVTVPSSCWTPAGPPRPPRVPLSCSEDSGSDGSSVSHATSPGSSSPDICALRPLSPPMPPGPRGAWGAATARPALLLPPGALAAGRYVLVAEGRLPPGEEQALALRLQQRPQPVRPRGRPARTPSLKDSPTGRPLCRAAVTQELQSWVERAHLRGARPHSLDRQGAFRVHSLPPGRALASRAQAPAMCVLRRSPEGAPVQIFVPENGEIVSQV